MGVWFFHLCYWHTCSFWCGNNYHLILSAWHAPYAQRQSSRFGSPRADSVTSPSDLATSYSKAKGKHVYESNGTCTQGISAPCFQYKSLYLRCDQRFPCVYCTSSALIGCIRMSFCSIKVTHYTQKLHVKVPRRFRRTVKAFCPSMCFCTGLCCRLRRGLTL